MAIYHQARQHLRRSILLSRWHCAKLGNRLHSNASNAALNNRDVLDIVVVAFNDSELIKAQHQALVKNLKDDFCYSVFDNSTRQDKRTEIKSLCAALGIGYIDLPKNPYSGCDPSSSHGLALNWAYKNYIKPRQARYFGTLDHDVFLTKPSSIVLHLKTQPVYGHLQERGELWYLWPGFSFFNHEFVAAKKLNFMPYKNLDTGGANWQTVFSQIAKSGLEAPPHWYQSLTGGDDTQADKVEWFGDWLHVINASNWKQVKTAKDFSALL